jgi:pimeloyl-ACP methyl ester carboxylesterase
MRAERPETREPSTSPGAEMREALAKHSKPILSRRSERGIDYLEGGEGPTVVLLHGRGGAGLLWRAHLLALAERHRVLAPDLPGFGRSAPGVLSGSSAERGARFFVDPIATWLEEVDAADAVLVGHSLGGLVALELALRDLDRSAPRIRRVVLIGGMGLGPSMTLASRVYFRAGPERLARRLGPRLFGRIAPFPSTAEGRKLGELEYELHTVPGGRPEASAAFDRLYRLSGPAYHRATDLRRLDRPVSLLWGEHDNVFPLAVAKLAAAVLPRATLRILPAGHSPQHDVPELVGAELARLAEV